MTGLVAPSLLGLLLAGVLFKRPRRVAHRAGLGVLRGPGGLRRSRLSRLGAVHRLRRARGRRRGAWRG
ncbi:MAG TPA: hypothetical protein VFS50_08120 [Meiothermus sp.]|nr:hypothetical protein [Meiothermus sp.]